MLQFVSNLIFLCGTNETILLILGSCLLAIAVGKLPCRKKIPLPPGPSFTFPFLGHLLLLGKWPHLTLYNLTQRYGPIASLRLGSSFAVVLSDYKLLNQTLKLKGDIFSDRPANNPFYLTAEKNLAGTNGWQWAEHRKFFDKYLKNAGIGESRFEEKIMEEVSCFLDHCEKRRQHEDESETEGIDFENDLAISVANNTCLLVFGRRFDYNDPMFQKLIHNENELTRLYNTANINFFMPGLATILQFFSLSNALENIRSLAKNFDKFSEVIVKDHKLNPNNYLKDDYIITFLEEKQLRKDNGTKDEVFTSTWLSGILHTLYGGGVETAFTVIRFAILAMIRDPDLQQKVHEELNRVIGSRTVTLNDRRHTPLTWATLQEVLRIVTPLPLGVPRSNSKETVIEGYRIPKDSYIIPNLYYIHHDPTLWENPFEFQPERFIVNGEVIKSPYLLPFGVGKRSCPGEALGNAEDFLYFASLMQHYELKSPVDIQQLPPLMPDKPSLVSLCPPYKVIMKRRNI